jgi:arginyl-tRNA synthetase
LQYATARISSIFARAGLDQADATGPVTLGHPAERALALRLLGLGWAIAETAQSAEPHRLAGYVFDTASEFTTFYEQCPVLKAGDPATRQSRLALTALTGRVLRTGLDLLGIPVPERM